MADAAKIAGTVISGINSVLGGGWIQGIMQKRENARQRKYEQEFYQTQKADNLEFWKMENMYNSPEMQMQRLKKAGLNPNLVYGNGATAEGGSINSPSQSASNSTKVGDIRPQLPDLYQLRLIDAQTNLTNQQAKTQETNQALNIMNAELRALEKQKLSISNEFDRKTLNDRIDTVTANYKNLLANTVNTQMQTRTQEFQQQNLSANTRSIIDNNIRQWQHNNLSLKQAAENIRNTQASTKERLSNVAFTDSNTQYTQQKNLTEKFISAIQALEYTAKQNGYNLSDSFVQQLFKGFFAGGYSLANKAIDQIEEKINEIKKHKGGK